MITSTSYTPTRVKGDLTPETAVNALPDCGTDSDSSVNESGFAGQMLSNPRKGRKSDILNGSVVSDSLYFILADKEYLKIGRTRDVAARLRWIRCSCPLPVTLIGALENQGWLESVWHSAFRFQKAQGEWFKITRELQSAVEIALKGGDWISTLGHDEQGDAKERQSILRSRTKALMRKIDPLGEYSTPTATASGKLCVAGGLSVSEREKL
jgi:Meiotically up-regulated gene 113